MHSMRADFDSWRDDIEQGDGYAIGGAGTFRPVRIRQRWRAAIIQQLRLVILDMVVILLCAVSALLAALTRWLPFLVLTALLMTFAGLWFRHQRLAHERRPR